MYSHEKKYIYIQYKALNMLMYVLRQEWLMGWWWAFNSKTRFTRIKLQIDKNLT